MFKVVATNVVVSKGYGENPALSFFNNDEIVRFRIGHKVYDSKAEDNTRWMNMTVKAFNGVCERIKKMKIKEGSYINILGHLDEDTWTDSNNEKKSMIVVIIDDIEYASGGGNGKNGDNKSDGGSKSSDKKKKPESSDNFTGYEGFGGNSFFDED